MSKECYGCKTLLSLTHSDRVPVHLEPLVLPASFSGRERVKGQTYCCLACGAYWVDAPPTAAMLPRFRQLSMVLAIAKPAQIEAQLALDVLAAGLPGDEQRISAS